VQRSGGDQEEELVRDPDTRVQDPLALAEIELYGELVIAATSSERPLTREEIDRVLGVERVDGGSR
jgi:hypothetical protein